MYQKTVLPNGIRVVTEDLSYLKSVSLGVWVGTGSRFEQEDNHGVSHFIEHLMFKGTKQRSARQIAEIVDAVGGQLNAFTAKECTCFYIKVLDTHQELAMDILSDMLLNSKFDPEDIRREKDVVLEEVNLYEDSPDEIIHDLHFENIWGKHPLGRNILGSAASIEAFTRPMVNEYCGSFYTPDNFVIAAAGNVNHEAVVALAQQYFGAMEGRRQSVNLEAPQLFTRRLITPKDTEQVHLCLGTSSVPQDHPDLYAAYLLNTILGGSISSRLFQSIREERGLAYSVYSYLSNYRDGGLFTIYAGTRPGNASQVMELIAQNLQAIRSGNIKPEELTNAKEQLKGNLLLGLESSSSRMSRIGKNEVTLGKYVPLEEIVSRIDRVTLPQLNDMAAQMFRTDTYSYTAIGPVDEAAFGEVTA